MSSGQALIDPITLTAVLTAPLFVVVLVIVLAPGSGWSGLSRKFPLLHPVQGHVLRYASMGINSIGYTGCLTLIVAPQGIAISIMAPFSLLQKPIFIDWQQIISMRHTRLLGMRRLEIRLRDDQAILRFRGSAIPAISATAQPHIKIISS